MEYKKYYIKYRKKFSKFINLFSNKKYLSFGENCLADDILNRYYLKSYSSPYGSCRSNVEYILQIEKDVDNDFLNPKYLEICGTGGDVRNIKYLEVTNKYAPNNMEGFDFPHHNVLENANARDTIGRRVARLRNLGKSKTLNILYHHCYCEDTDIDLLCTHLKELKDLYEQRCKRVNIFAFTQVLVSDESERKVEKSDIDGVYLYRFYTTRVWQGNNNEDIFWAKPDDDLIAIMMKDMRNV